MITRIELDGFKTFQKFDLDFSPFQVIVGPNAAGKSNLFDALQLLSKLADSDLRTAFQELRGEAGELFTTMPDDKPTARMSLAVEMLVERTVRDSWGAVADLKHTRLRYELEISRRADEQGLERLYVTREALNSIRRADDPWFRRNIGREASAWQPSLKTGRSTPFISTEMEADPATLHLHQDGHGGRKASVAEKVERTVLSGVANTEFPHAFAAREEMRGWRFLQLNPEVLRQPSSMLAHPHLAPDGGNLPSTLARMYAEDPHLFNDVSRDLANLVPGILKVEVEKDQPLNRYIVQVQTQDGRVFKSRVLSDGTLRLLALVTLKNDPQHDGVLCFEEPENGVHPFRLQQMVDVLQNLATDFSDPEQVHLPLRQLLVNTHSPVLVSHRGVMPNLLFAYMSTRVQPGEETRPMRVTRIVPVGPRMQAEMNLGIESKERRYTIAQVLEYLDTVDLGEARATLHAAEV